MHVISGKQSDRISDGCHALSDVQALCQVYVRNNVYLRPADSLTDSLMDAVLVFIADRLGHIRMAAQA